MSPVPASVSLILPATDETFSLSETVRRAQELLPNHRLTFIVVTSPKLTTEACRATIAELIQEYGAQVETFDQTLPGVGGAVRDAFARSKSDYTILMASDLETDPAALPALVAGLDSGMDVVATTRWRGGADFKGYHPVKLFFNFFFQHFFRILYWTDLTDLTYGYRAYRTEVVRRIRWEETRFPFFFEGIIKPLRLGYKTAEIKVSWTARVEGESHADLGQVLSYAKTGLRGRFAPKAKMVY